MKKIMNVLLALCLCMMLNACGSKETSDLKEVTLILDYVPNTNHSGIYVAQKLGYFEEEGLKVNIIEPTDATSTTLVGVKQGEFGISYQEDVTYALTSEEPLPIKAIATVIQHNTSGFVSLKEANINSAKDFEGKVYAGWQAPSEEAVIKAVMEKERADFSKLTMITADGSGFAALGKTVDFYWDFEGWATLKAKMEGYDLNYIPCYELDERLDYYTPVVIANTQVIEEDHETVQKFMNAMKKGYEYAINHVDETVEIMAEILPDYDIEFLKASQQFLSSQYSLDSDTWGLMKDEVWDNYTSFMYEAGLIDQKIEASEQYTNEFIK